MSSLFLSEGESRPYSPLKSQSLLMSKSHTLESLEGERSAVLTWLLQSPDAEVCQVLGILAERKSWVLQQALEEVKRKASCTSHTPRPEADTPTPRLDPQMRSLCIAPLPTWTRVQSEANKMKEVVPSAGGGRSMASLWGEDSTVQFSSPIYLVEENAEEVVLDILRIGPTDEACAVSYATRDCSALAGEAFEASEGTLFFQPGEVIKSIPVKLIDNALWDTNPEFAVVLCDPAGAVLGEYLAETRVKIIDDDTFPSNQFREQIEAQRYEDLPRYGLLREYLMRNIAEPMIKKGTYKMIMVGVLDSMLMATKLLVNLYILQFVLRSDVPEEQLIFHDRLDCLCLCMGVLLGFFALQHRLHYIQPTWRVAGLSRRVLQHGILSAFLSYGEDSRTKVDDGQIVMAMIYDVPNLVNNGFMSLVALANAAGKLIIILIFQILVPPLLGRSPTLLGLAPALCIPGITCIFLLFRVEHQTRILTNSEDQEAKLVGHISENVRTFRLISDFGQSARVLDTFQEKIASFNKSAIDCAQMIENNAKFVEWLTTMFVSIYTIWAGIQVIDGSLGLGLYITNIGVFNAAGAAGSEMCHVLLQMQKVTPSLDRLVKYINLPTDLIKRKNLERHRRIVTARLCGETTHERGPGFVLDKLPIIISELEFQYPNLRPRAFGGRMEFPQGKLMAIVGGCGQGKSTLLRMLAGRNLPRLTNQETSLFFIPSHIQVLYVPHSPIFFHGTLYDNLVYGVRFARHEEDANVERVVSICRRLKLPAQILDYVTRNNKERDWAGKLSSTQCQALLLARAFIANPELLCLEKPTEQFSHDDAENIFELVSEHVSQRGLEADEAAMVFRRPRTCFFTTMRLSATKHADEVYMVSRDLGVRRVEGSELTEAMLK